MKHDSFAGNPCVSRVTPPRSCPPCNIQRLKIGHNSRRGSYKYNVSKMYII